MRKLRTSKTLTACLAFVTGLVFCAPRCPADEFDTKFAEILEIEDNTERLGDSGRLFIPETGIDVALFYAENNLDDEAQKITDEADSAVFMPWIVDQSLIADHWTQGFINIRDCREGTRAYIKKEDCIEVYVCTEVAPGHNLISSFLINTDKPHEYRISEEQATAGESISEQAIVLVNGPDENTETTSPTDSETTPFKEPEDPGSQPASYETDHKIDHAGGESSSGPTSADIDRFTKPGEWTGFFPLETEEGQSEYETETEVFWGQPLEYISDFDLFMYTCNGRWQDIYLALFTLEEVIPL